MPSTLQFVVNGIVFSSIIILGAIGLSLVYSIANFANFAHGDLMTVGAFGAFVGSAYFSTPTTGNEAFLGLPLFLFAAVASGAVVGAMVVAGRYGDRFPGTGRVLGREHQTIYAGLGGAIGGGLLLLLITRGLASALPESGVALLGLPLHFYAALLAGMGLAAVVAVVTERYVYRPLDTGGLELLITSIGVALAYRALVQMKFGSSQRTYDLARTGPLPFFQETLGVSVTESDVVIVSLSLILVVGLHVLLQYTMLGRKMRATSDNASLARVSGIRTQNVIVWMWIIGGALAAAGGVFLGLDTLIRPRMGFDLLLVIFAAVILGGIGSVYGAVLGGFAIGMAHELTALIPFVPIEYAKAVAFILMVVILLYRPSGIMGGEGA